MSALDGVRTPTRRDGESADVTPNTSDERGGSGQECRRRQQFSRSSRAEWKLQSSGPPRQATAVGDGHNEVKSLAKLSDCRIIRIMIMRYGYSNK